MGDFNHLENFWESNTIVYKQSRRFLGCGEGNFLIQMLDKLTRGKTLLRLVLTNADELTEEVKLGGILGCSDNALVDFVI